MHSDDDAAATIPPWQAARSSGPRPERGATATFATDELIASRYRIEKFVAFGGMGEVYAALDTELGERVALKTVREDVAADPRVVERFKREIALARKVTHRNVCRIFDLGVHRAAVDTGDGLAAPKPPQTFLTMELLDGESLGDRIARSGPITTEAALPLVEQMVAALAAAHEVGVVHRDFKSGNVLLVPDGDGLGSKGTRVVVTDFGLARASRGDDPYATNGDGDAGMVGSPVYMAPEQVEGGPVDKTADIYALGVVLFEMLTANIPFTGDTAMAIAVKRIKEAAPSPRMFVPTLDPRWEQAVLRCLERAPQDRFAEARDVLRFLVGEPLAKPLPPITRPLLAPGSRARRSRWLRVGVTVGALGLAAGGLLWWQKPTAPITPPATITSTTANAPTRRSIAVVGFSNTAQRPEADWISTALSEMFTTDLGNGGKLRLVPGESVGRMKRDLQLANAASYAPDTLDKIKRNLDADLVVVGSYVSLGKQLRVDVRMQDAATGETLAQVAETAASEAELATVVSRVSAQLRDKLQVAQVAPTEGQAFVNTALPQNPEAAKLYADAVARIRLYKMAEARDLLERAINIEPDFPLSHSALSQALNYLGAEDRAHDEIKKAFDLREKLSTEGRLRVESLYYLETEDKQRRLEASKQLSQLAPDNLDYTMAYTDALYDVDEKAGLALFEKVAQTAQAKNEPRFLLRQSAIAYAKHDFETVIAQAKQLAKMGEERGTLSFVGEAKSNEAFSQWFLGNLNDGIAAADEARRIAFTLGDRDGVAGVLTTKAFIQSDLGDYAGAQQSSEDALKFAAEVGSRRRVWLAQHTLARAYTFRGELRTGLEQFENSRKTSVEQHSKYGEAIAYIGIAATQILQGELKQAQPTFDKILFQSRLFAPKNAIAYVQHFRGELFRWKGEWREARAAYEEAIKIRDDFHDKFQAQRDRLGLSQVALHEGKLDEAAALAEPAAKLFASISAFDDEAFARRVLVEVALQQKKLDVATAQLGRVATIAAKSQSAMVKLEAAHAKAELLAAQNQPTEAVKLLDEWITLANDRGILGYSLALQKTRAELDPKTTPEAKTHLRETADRLGLAWIATASSLR